MQLLTFGLAAMGAAMAWKRLYPRHCRLLPVALALNFISVSYVMIPSFLKFAQALTLTAFGSPTVLLFVVHGIVGAVALSLSVAAIMTTTRFASKFPRIRNNKALMRVAFLLWLLTLLLGLLIYRTIYG